MCSGVGDRLVESTTERFHLLGVFLRGGAEGEATLLYLLSLSPRIREFVLLLTCASLGGIFRLCF